jgi:hypothetical protein
MRKKLPVRKISLPFGRISCLGLVVIVGPIKVKLVMIAGTIVSQVRDLTRRASPVFRVVEQGSF